MAGLGGHTGHGQACTMAGSTGQAYRVPAATLGMRNSDLVYVCVCVD
jgi:hypothetical protein